MSLKGLVDPVHVFGVNSPDLEWLDRPLISTQENAGNLPRLRTDSVGDLADMQRRVSRLANARLVTLTGSGGVGKTRAALEVGWLVVDEFVDGVWLAELGPIADVETVTAAVASTLSVQLQPGMTMIESIVDWCFGRRMLLILDNCEHVLDPISELASAIMSSCPTVTVLATSREPLGVPGEQVIRIPSLDSDQSAELFCDRAASADSSFNPSSADLEAIHGICDRLDGIPLAIELAAARSRSLSPTDLLARLDDRFRVLRGGGRGGMERHQTLRAAVTWSYQLLSDKERLLFDRLTVFAGEFDLEAAEKICVEANENGSATDIDQYDIVDLIGQLVDKSMVIATHSDIGTRYRLLETLRQYGEEQLDDRGETVRARDRHLAHYGEVASLTYQQWVSPEQVGASAIIDRDWDNLRAALNWAIASEQLDSANEILNDTSPHAISALHFEHREWASRTLMLGNELGSVAATTYSSASFWAFFAADAPAAIEYARAGIDLHPDDPNIGFCHSALLYALMAAGRTAEASETVPGLVDLLAGDPDLANTVVLRQSLAEACAAGLASGDHVARFTQLSIETGAPAIVARSMMTRGTAQLSAAPPDLTGALASFREVIRRGEVAAPAEVVWGHCGVSACRVLDQHRDAETAVREALTRGYDARLWLAVDVSLEACVRLLMDSLPEAAATILGHLEQRPTPAFGVNERIRRESLATVADFADGSEWMANGADMDRHEIVAYALSHLDQDQENDQG